MATPGRTAGLLATLVVVAVAHTRNVHAQNGIGKGSKESRLPVVVNTWAFTDATAAAWAALTSKESQTPHLDAVVEVNS